MGTYATFPDIVTELAAVATAPVQAGGTFILDDVTNGKLDTNTLGAAETWTAISTRARSGTISRPSTRQMGPLYVYQAATMAVALKNDDGALDPDNLAGPFVAAGVTELNPMVPVRQHAVWNGTDYPLFWGFTDGFSDDGQNYGGRYAEVPLTATDGFKVLGGINLATLGAPAGGGETSGTRVRRILDAAGWYTGTGYRVISTGDSVVQATSYGDNALALLQVTADSEIGELYISGAGAVVFRNRHGILTDTRSAAVQAIFGDSPGTLHTLADGVTVLPELPYGAPRPRNRDDTTLANDIQATAVGGSLQEATDAASVLAYRFARSYTRDDLILTGDPDALNWAQWVLSVAKAGEDRLDSVTVSPMRDPADLWPQALGREIGDRIEIWIRPPGVASPVVKDCFIRGITHTWSMSPMSWTTTWTLQDASKYGSFFVLNDPVLGQLSNNSLAF